MRKHAKPPVQRLSSTDRRRLERALSVAREARLYRRTEAVLLIAEGQSVSEAARRVRASGSVFAGGSNATWVLRLTPQQARRKAGMASKHYWLRNLVNEFWLPT